MHHRKVRLAMNGTYCMIDLIKWGCFRVLPPFTICRTHAMSHGNRANDELREQAHDDHGKRYAMTNGRST
jgi:hypothetical protein